MKRTEIFNKLCEIFRSVLNEDDLEIMENYTAEDVDGWDSLTHIMLVVSIEKSFDIRFLSSEITSWKNVKEIVDSIYSKTKK